MVVRRKMKNLTIRMPEHKLNELMELVKSADQWNASYFIREAVYEKMKREKEGQK